MNNDILNVDVLTRTLEGDYVQSDNFLDLNIDETFVKTEWGGILLLRDLYYSLRKMGGGTVRLISWEAERVVTLSA